MSDPSTPNMQTTNLPKLAQLFAIHPDERACKFKTFNSNRGADFARVLTWLITNWDYELIAGHTALMIAKRLIKSDRYVILQRRGQLVPCLLSPRVLLKGSFS